MKKFISGFLVFSLVCLISSPVFAMPGIGARAVGMGGAYTALARDITAAYWNPAGLIKSGKLAGDAILSAGYDGNVTLQDLAELGDFETFLEDNWEDEIEYNIGASGILGASVRGIGISYINWSEGYFNKGAEESPPIASPSINGFLSTKNCLAVTFGTNIDFLPLPFVSPVAVGANVRSVNGMFTMINHAGGVGTPVTQVTASGNGIGLDLGMQADIAPTLTLGVALRDLMTGMTYSGDSDEYAGIDPSTGELIGTPISSDYEYVDRAPTHIVVGVASDIPMLATLAADVDIYEVEELGQWMDFHLGAEGHMFGFVSPRIGYYTENNGKDTNMTLGLGFGIGPVGADFAYGWSTTDPKDTELVFAISGGM